jgi:hypothetical protein
MIYVRRTPSDDQDSECETEGGASRQRHVLALAALSACGEIGQVLTACPTHY